MQIFPEILLLAFPFLLHFKCGECFDHGNNQVHPAPVPETGNEHRPHQIYVRMRNGLDFIGYIEPVNNWEVLKWLRPNQFPTMADWAFVRLQSGNPHPQYHQYKFRLFPPEPRDEQAAHSLTFPDYVEVTIENHKHTANEFEPYFPHLCNHGSGTRERPQSGNYPPANHVYVNMVNGRVYYAAFVPEL